MFPKIINTALRRDGCTGCVDHGQYEWISEVILVYRLRPEPETISLVLLLHTGLNESQRAG